MLIDRYLSINRDNFSKITSDQKIWLVVRVNYSIAEYLMYKYSGKWILVDDPTSVFFSNYVVECKSQNCDDTKYLLDKIVRIDYKNKGTFYVDLLYISYYIIDNINDLSLKEVLEKLKLL